MKKAIFTIGIPGSGKSTIAKKLYSNSDYIFLDCDSIKEKHFAYNPLNPELLHNWSKKELAVFYIKNNKGYIVDIKGNRHISIRFIILHELKHSIDRLNNFKGYTEINRKNLEIFADNFAIEKLIEFKELNLEKSDNLCYTYNRGKKQC